MNTRAIKVERAKRHIAKFAHLTDEDFVRKAIRHSRYLDIQSREIAREALRRFNVLHPENEE